MEIIMHIDISKKLKELITINNMNVKEFAEYTGVSRTSLNGYLNNKVMPTIEPLVQICTKCNVSLDWLCSLNSTRHFLTMADIINAFAEINNLDELTANISTIKDNNSLSSTITVDGNTFHPSKLNHHVTCNDYLCNFLYDWEKTIEQLSKLDDEEIKSNYYQMWWDKQISYYSTIPLKTKHETSEEFSEQLYTSLMPHRLKLGD